MSVKKDKNKAKESIIKAQEELLASSINGLRDALDLLHQLVRVKESLTKQTVNRKKIIAPTNASTELKRSQQDRKTDREVNTDHCSKGFTLH